MEQGIRVQGVHAGALRLSDAAVAIAWMPQSWWRRRELNPRPKMLSAKRLHT